MTYKNLSSAIAIVLTLIAFMPYIRSIWQGKTKPHVFSWVIWGCTTCIVFFAQLAGHAGIGAWPIGISGAISIYVAVLAYLKHADLRITGFDWFLFSLAMAALPLWYITSSPLWTVVLLTTIDLIGFGLTFKKAYRYPFEEPLMFYALMALRNGFALLALEFYSTTTVLFPALTGFTAVAFVFMVIKRREACLPPSLKQ